jgi:hypothetical protein
VFAPRVSIPVGAIKSILNKNRSKITIMIIATITKIIVHRVPSILEPLCIYDILRLTNIIDGKCYMFSNRNIVSLKILQ